jgi:segregation and condensation protein B
MTTMDDAQAKRIIEAILFVFSQPVAVKRLSEVLPDLGPGKIRELIDALNASYLAEQRAFAIQELAGGYQLVTDQQLAPWIRRALQTHRPPSVSTAALETLAIVAYRQPITKAEIEAIRGVDVGASLDTLVERQFVRVAGRKESPGRPFLYGTTTDFLRHFGLKSIEALPKVEFPAIKEPEAEPPVPPAAEAAASADEAAVETPEPEPSSADGAPASSAGDPPEQETEEDAVAGEGAAEKEASGVPSELTSP